MMITIYYAHNCHQQFSKAFYPVQVGFLHVLANAMMFLKRVKSNLA